MDRIAHKRARVAREIGGRIFGCMGRPKHMTALCEALRWQS